MKIQAGTEVRTTDKMLLTEVRFFFFDGQGHARYYNNDGQPDVLNAIRTGEMVSGRMRGNIKIVRIKGANNWYSLRSVGASGDKATFYVKGDTLVVTEDGEATVAGIFSRA